MTKHLKSITSLLITFSCVTTSAAAGWKQTLDEQLPMLGHRNWIVIADAAYPKQSAAGIETVVTGSEHFEVLETVLAAVDAAPHVQPTIMLDTELEYVDAADAPGVAEFRAQLTAALKDRQLQVKPHEEIIAQLDADSKVFNILLLKTDLVIPYTSIFIQLDCGYWNGEKEARLLRTISNAETNKTR